MNILNGSIARVESNGLIRRVTVNIGPACITAVLLDGNETGESLLLGKNVVVRFKEAETALALELPARI